VDPSGGPSPSAGPVSIGVHPREFGVWWLLSGINVLAELEDRSAFLRNRHAYAYSGPSCRVGRDLPMDVGVGVAVGAK